MSWKDISKSSYTVESAKFTLPRPSHPFTIPYQGPKVRYSEGDEMASVVDYIFNLDFTTISLGPDHFPCGYWHKNYIPPFTIIYTTLLYPVEVVDSISVDIGLRSGDFRSIVQYLDIGIDLLSNSISVLSGIHSTNIQLCELEDYIDVDVNVVSGVFRIQIKYYTIPYEGTNVSNSIVSGVFRDAMIIYSYWPTESVDTDITLIAGYHNA